MNRAVIVLNVGRDMLCPASRESIAAAARRWNADFQVIRSPILKAAHPYWQKLAAHRILNDYTQVLQLDADVLISSACQDPFELVDQRSFGVVNVAQPGARPYRMRRERAMQYWGARMGYSKLLPDEQYLNAGFMLYCPAFHKDLFAAALAYGADDYSARDLPEQTVMSLCLDRRREKIQWLPASLNRITRRRAQSRSIIGEIEHFVGGRKRMRIECVDWNMGDNLGTKRRSVSVKPRARRIASVSCSPLKQPWQPSDVTFLTSTKSIPKLAHFIWLGQKPLPGFGQDAIETFRGFHIDWEVKLWRKLPEDIPAELLGAIEASPLLVHQADILRAWLLYKYGGFYFDVDFVFFRRIDELLGDCPIVMKTRRDITNAAMASPPGSAFFRLYLSLIVKQSGLGGPKSRNSYGPRALRSLCQDKARVFIAPRHWFALFSGPARRRFYRAGEELRSKMIGQKRHLFCDGVEPFGLHIGVGSRTSVASQHEHPLKSSKNFESESLDQVKVTQYDNKILAPSVAKGDASVPSGVRAVARAVFLRSADRVDRFLFRYLGQPVFLICGGPTSGSIDWHQLRQSGIPSMCLNNATRLYWPEMWIAIDDPMHFDPQLWTDDRVLKFTTVARANSLLPHSDASDRTVAECPSTVLFRRTKPFCRDKIFGGDTGMPHLARRFTMACALRVLYLLGFRHVFLLGADFYQSYQVPYAYRQNVTPSSVQSSNAHFRSLNTRFSMMRASFESRGFHIYNCSHESRLKAFDVMPLEQAFDTARLLRSRLNTPDWDNTLLGDKS